MNEVKELNEEAVNKFHHDNPGFREFHIKKRIENVKASIKFMHLELEYCSLDRRKLFLRIESTKRRILMFENSKDLESIVGDRTDTVDRGRLIERSNLKLEYYKLDALRNSHQREDIERELKFSEETIIRESETIEEGVK
jgi:hypothetical protein